MCECFFFIDVKKKSTIYVYICTIKTNVMLRTSATHTYITLYMYMHTYMYVVKGTQLWYDFM